MIGTLRGRVIAGAVLWSLGLSLVGILVTGWVLSLGPGYPRLFHGFAEAHAGLVLIVAFACLVFGIWQVRRGFAPMATLRDRLGDVRSGREARIGGRYPFEVQPLVDELNALLADRERRVERALARAGDLAHGLKTPLAVLAQEAERPSAADPRALPAIVGQQVARMQRQIDRHLAHARAAAAGVTPGARCVLQPAAEGLARTMHRLHADRRLTIDVRVPADHAVRGQLEDVEEMLGNLLDNACKWARTRVTVASDLGPTGVAVTIDDDGAGLDPSLWEAVVRRGVRADEAAPGTGFGLAIARELAELHGGTLTIGRSPDGGVRARLELPAA
jgi:signal transduction histidine kinase